MRVLPCTHPFHATCVDPWIESHFVCPMCKASLLPGDADGSLAARLADERESLADEGRLFAVDIALDADAEAEVDGERAQPAAAEPTGRRRSLPFAERLHVERASLMAGEHSDDSLPLSSPPLVRHGSGAEVIELRELDARADSEV